MGIQDDSQGHILHGQAADGFTAEVGPGDDLQRLDALGHQGTGTAQSGQIDRAVADNGFLDSGIPLALADHNFVAQVTAGGGSWHPSGRWWWGRQSR